MGYFVDVQGVTHVYGGGDGSPAVEDLTVRVKEGEFAAIVGPSGCGKSTMMKLAAAGRADNGGELALLDPNRQILDRRRAVTAAIDMGDALNIDKVTHEAP